MLWLEHTIRILYNNTIWKINKQNKKSTKYKMDKTSLTTQQIMKIVCINLIHQQKPKQAGAGVVPSSGLARSWSWVEVFMKSRWSLDVKIKNIL